jgi:hypothetical protein
MFFLYVLGAVLVALSVPEVLLPARALSSILLGTAIVNPCDHADCHHVSR